MRDAFHRELDDLDLEVVRMGVLVQQSTQKASTALSENDLALAQSVRDGDDEIDGLFLDIEARALVIMAEQAPVARDLRLLIAILRVSIDLERAGDLSYNIAGFVQLDDFSGPGLKGVRSLIIQLGQAASDLMGRSVEAWEKKDVTLAADISHQDDRLDDLHALLVQNLVELKGEENLAAAVHLAMIARYFERIGDHAVNLAERVRYLVTGDVELLA